MKKKIIAIALCAALAVGGVVAGSIAWLQDTTGPVVNTFTVGNIDIDLTEHALNEDGTELNSSVTTSANSYDVIPGTTYPKDPFVTVNAKSEPCYLFVTVKEEGGTVSANHADGHQPTTTDCNFDCFLQYEVDGANWKPLMKNSSQVTAADGALVYYLTIDSETTQATPYYVIKNNTIKVRDTVTKAMVDKLTTENQPKLTFKAAAVQKANVADENTAWDLVKDELAANNG